MAETAINVPSDTLNQGGAYGQEAVAALSAFRAVESLLAANATMPNLDRHFPSARRALDKAGKRVGECYANQHVDVEQLAYDAHEALHSIVLPAARAVALSCDGRDEKQARELADKIALAHYHKAKAQARCRFEAAAAAYRASDQPRTYTIMLTRNGQSLTTRIARATSVDAALAIASKALEAFGRDGYGTAATCQVQCTLTGEFAHRVLVNPRCRFIVRWTAICSNGRYLSSGQSVCSSTVSADSVDDAHTAACDEVSFAWQQARAESAVLYGELYALDCPAGELLALRQWELSVSINPKSGRVRCSVDSRGED